MFNPTPEPGNEYILVKVTITCNAASSDKCSLFPMTELQIVTSPGVLIQPTLFVAGMTGMMEPSQQLFGGAKISGGLVYSVPKNDSGLILSYDSIFPSYQAFLALK